MIVYQKPEREPVAEASELLQAAAERAMRSLAFFTRGVLGLRRLSAARLEALQAGASPATRLERSAVERWSDFRAGRAEGIAQLFLRQAAS